MNLTTRIAAATLLLATAVGFAQAEPIKVTFGNGGPRVAHFSVQIFEPWVEKVNADSSGTLEIDYVPDGVLGSDSQLYDRVVNGVADIGFFMPQYYPGRFPKAEVTALPLLFSSPLESSLAVFRLNEQGFFDDFKDVEVLSAFAFPGALMMTRGPIGSIADVKGQKIIAGGKIRAAVANAVGASPISLPADETYQSISRGLATGVIGPYSVIQPFSLMEVLTHYYEIPLGGTTALLVMNKTKYDALPPEAQDALKANSGEVMARQFAELWKEVEAEAKSKIAAAGQEIVVPSEQDIEAWRTAVSPIYDEFVATTPNGTAILQAFKDEVANIKAGN